VARNGCARKLQGWRCACSGAELQPSTDSRCGSKTQSAGGQKQC
jgi:hypothetical protein